MTVAPKPDAPVVHVTTHSLREVMAKFEHDVAGKCWHLWEELKALCHKAEHAVVDAKNVVEGEIEKIV